MHDYASNMSLITTVVPFLSLFSRARTNDDAEGLVKVITDAETDRLLGVHIIGPVRDTPHMMSHCEQSTQ